MMGIPELRQAIAAHYGRWHGLTLDPMTEVMVTSGGTEALTASILAVVEPGDEVVVFQPVYDSYLPIIRQAGGIPRLVRLEPPHWRLTEEMLRERLQPQDQGGAVQQSAQSGRRGLSARGPRIAGAVLPGVRHHRDLRRGLGARRSSTAASISR